MKAAKEFTNIALGAMAMATCMALITLAASILQNAYAAGPNPVRVAEGTYQSLYERVYEGDLDELIKQYKQHFAEAKVWVREKNTKRYNEVMEKIEIPNAELSRLRTEGYVSSACRHLAAARENVNQDNVDHETYAYRKYRDYLQKMGKPLNKECKATDEELAQLEAQGYRNAACSYLGMVEDNPDYFAARAALDEYRGMSKRYEKATGRKIANCSKEVVQSQIGGK